MELNFNKLQTLPISDTTMEVLTVLFTKIQYDKLRRFAKQEGQPNLAVFVARLIEETCDELLDNPFGDKGEDSLEI